MIFSIKITDGFATKLPALKNKTFKFGPGLTLLSGPNGCGKSTLLKCIAAYTGIKNGGFTRPLKFGDIFCIHSDPEFPKDFRRFSPGNCTAELEWDGALTCLHDSRAADQTHFGYFFESASDSNDGMTTMADQVTILTQKPSAGQLRLHKLGQLVRYIEHHKHGKEIPQPKHRDAKDDDVTKAHMAYWNAVRAKHQTHVPTLLLDEPENGLAIHLQIVFWQNLVPNLIRMGYQVIVASHNPLATFCPVKASNIELKRGYNQALRTVLEEYVQGTLSPQTLSSTVAELEGGKPKQEKTEKT